ncbi:hypothetical protein CBP31_10000 [Oceanisphaera profunda]|uniref:Serine kinase n=1 Tax=Oceanisphaera profunda TaxID=1416627 RepID=A0A1Y0D6X1_9GAMM|nr:PqqD family protein [Oceanisphaera profunda]ART82916.1 hypothetical protein CBP31_10000 [Oceanisphaera profunda]
MNAQIPPSAVDISLPHLGRCLRIDQAPEVVSALTQAMPGWPITVLPAQDPIPDRYVYQDAEGLWQGCVHEPNEFHLPSPASAACSLVAELVSQRMLNEPDLLGLHCASVEINGHLVLFPESSKAGKSTLSVAFAAAGYRVFGDDVLGLTPQGAGVAMGVAPRLRLPLPNSFPAEFVAYSERHAGPEDERYRFVIPDENGLAKVDENCPVGAIVLLERDSHILEPEVVTLPPAEGLLQLLCQNFARETSSATLLTRLLPLMQAVPCLLLRYSEPLAGARHLAQAIKDPQLYAANQASLLNLPPHALQQRGPITAQTTLEHIWSAQHAVTAYPLGDELFLINTTSGAIHRLNSSGKIAWQLLQQQPLSGHDLSDVMASYFKAPLAAVTADVATLLTALAQAGLVTNQP